MSDEPRTDDIEELPPPTPVDKLQKELAMLEETRAEGDKEIRMLERDLIMSQTRAGRGSFRSGRGRGGRFSPGSSRFFGLAQTGPSEGGARASSNFGGAYAPLPTVLSTISMPTDDRSDDDSRARARGRKRRRDDEDDMDAKKARPDPSARKRLIKATKKLAQRDPTIRKRNKRFFGGLLNHLKRASRESKKTTRIAEKAKELLETQRESVQKYSETALLDRIKAKRVEKEKKDEIITWKMIRVTSTLLQEKAKSHFQNLGNFMWTTTTKPCLSWKPVDDDSALFDPVRSSGAKMLTTKLQDLVTEIEESIPEKPEEVTKEVPKDFEEGAEAEAAGRDDKEKESDDDDDKMKSEEDDKKPSDDEDEDDD